MQWAQSITSRNGQLLASVLDANGTPSLLPLGELAANGLPTCEKNWRRCLSFRLSDLQATTPDEYLEHFGIKANSAENLQSMYALHGPRVKWVIPALALIRGLFQPSRVLLSDVFRPQPVDRLAVVDPDNSRRVKIVAPWSNIKLHKAGSTVPTLEWLVWDQMANKLASSVHHHAMKGCIDLDLLPLDFEFSAYGDRKGKTTFVTNLSALKVTLSERSSRNPGEVHFLSQAAVGKRSSALHVERNATGDLQLTQQEWESVKQHALDYSRGSKYDLKTVFENLLAYATGEVATHKELKALETATPVDLEYHRCWTNAGKFTAMVDHLNRLRAK